MDLETDIHKDWEIVNGDLKLSQAEDNLSQAIINRLTCYQPNLEIYYENYGGLLHDHFGMRKDGDSLKFIKIELDSILSQEERITGFESNLEYGDDGDVLISLEVSVDDETIDLNLVFDEDGVSVAD